MAVWVLILLRIIKKTYQIKQLIKLNIFFPLSTEGKTCMHVFCLKLEMQVNKWVLFLYILNLKCEKCVLCCMLLTHFTIYIFKSPFSLPPSTRFNLRENLRANNFRQNWKYSLENQGESSENHQIGCQCVQCSIVSWLSVHSVQQSADLLCI